MRREHKEEERSKKRIKAKTKTMKSMGFASMIQYCARDQDDV